MGKMKAFAEEQKAEGFDDLQSAYDYAVYCTTVAEQENLALSHTVEELCRLSEQLQKELSIAESRIERLTEQLANALRERTERVHSNH